MKRESPVTPPPPQAPSKPSLTEEEVSKKSTAIIEEYIHIYDTKVDPVTRAGSARLLFCARRLRIPDLLRVPTGGSAVRAGAEQH